MMEARSEDKSAECGVRSAERGDETTRSKERTGGWRLAAGGW